MINILVVTLTAKGLDVDQSGGHHWLKRTPLPQDLYWVLSGPGLAHARFANPRRQRRPGFLWRGTRKDKPPTGIFGQARVIDDGRMLAMRVHHTGAATRGAWKYSLYVDCCDETFATCLSGDDIDCGLPPPYPCEDGVPCGQQRRRMIKDPVIINR